jgi:aminoglycoside phosphotransferase (APT) family kinase protein
MVNSETAALSLENVHALLAEISPGSVPLTIELMTGSFSNAAYVVDIQTAAGSAQRLVVRCYTPRDQIDIGQKARREYSALAMFQGGQVPAPRPLYLDQAGSILGAPGIVITFVAGAHDVRLTRSQVRTLAVTLANIHAVPLEAEAVDLLLDANTEAVWFSRNETVPDFMQGHADGSRVWQAVRDLRPRLRLIKPVLIHLDYWLQNILWQGEAIAAVVDWEEAAYGDPAIDVAYTRMGLVVEGMAEEADAFLAAYEAAAGRRVANLGFWELAAAARNMPDPAQWDHEWEALGGLPEPKKLKRQRFRQFIADALDRAQTEINT